MKYGIISLLFLMNNEILSLITLLALSAVFLCDIAKARLEDAEW